MNKPQKRLELFSAIGAVIVTALLVWGYGTCLRKATQYTPSGKIIDTFSCEGHKYIEFHYRGGGNTTIVHSQVCPCLKDTIHANRGQ